ncbi:MAG: hypothetical protein H7Y20_09595 [Bryobacteraceae bacterium]|nr:hypothetical protein [Bryobacteraceae bacterium]
MSFLDVGQQLSSTDAARLDQLHKSLERDYEVVTYLLRHAAGYNPSNGSFEQFLLRLDYQLMKLWYRIVRTASRPLARRALIEMTSVVSHLANAMGEKAAAATLR